MGSESLLRVNLTQRGVRAKLLSHDELVGSKAVIGGRVGRVGRVEFETRVGNLDPSNPYES